MYKYIKKKLKVKVNKKEKEQIWVTYVEAVH